MTKEQIALLQKTEVIVSGLLLYNARKYLKEIENTPEAPRMLKDNCASVAKRIHAELAGANVTVGAPVPATDSQPETDVVRIPEPEPKGSSLAPDSAAEADAKYAQEILNDPSEQKLANPGKDDYKAIITKRKKR